jgi:hypothetical protein
MVKAKKPKPSAKTESALDHHSHRTDTDGHKRKKAEAVRVMLDTAHPLSRRAGFDSVYA